MKHAPLLLGALVVLGGCKTPEEKYCGRSLDRFSGDKAACLIEYRAMTATQRTCADECIASTKVQDSDRCALGCLGRVLGEECGGINGPKAPASTSSSK